MIEPMFCMGRRGRPVDLSWAYSKWLGHYIVAHEDGVYLGAFGTASGDPSLPLRRWGLDEGWPAQIWTEIERRNTPRTQSFIVPPIRADQPLREEEGDDIGMRCWCDAQGRPDPQCAYCQDTGRTAFDLIRCSCTTRICDADPDPSCTECKGLGVVDGEVCECSVCEEDCDPQPACPNCDGKGYRPWGL